MTDSPWSIIATKKLNTRGLSCTVILKKAHLSKGWGNEGVTAVAEPQLIGHLAAPMDKGARRLGKKHTNTGICRGEIVGHNLHKHQILLVQQQTQAHTHPCIPNSNTASRAFTDACSARDNLTQSQERLQTAFAYSPPLFLQTLCTSNAAGGTG